VKKVIDGALRMPVLLHFNALGYLASPSRPGGRRFQ
jgi:hypothetical protein